MKQKGSPRLTVEAGIAQVYLLIILLVVVALIIAKFFYINITPVGVVGASTYRNLFGQEFGCSVSPPDSTSNSCSNYFCISNGCFTTKQAKATIQATPSITPTKSADETASQNGEIMTIKGQILDSNSQPFTNPELIINSVDSSEKCNVDTLGNYICSAKVIKGKTYGISLNKDKKTGFVLQYFGGDPSKTLELGIKKAPWTK